MFEKYYATDALARLVPQELVLRFGLPSPTGIHFPDNGVYTLKKNPVREGFSLQIKPDPNFTDPLYVISLTITHLGSLEISWIAANDPDSERYDVDLMERLPLKPKSGLRNIPEEVRAMRAGLAPNQVRKGLHILKPALRCVEDYANAVGAGFVTIFPMEYHNAIEYESCGFSYRSGEELIREINRGFGKKGGLTRLLTGESPFREPWMAGCVRGRAWAIHDGIMGSDWFAPEMYKAVGVKTARRRRAPIPW